MISSIVLTPRKLLFFWNITIWIWAMKPPLKEPANMEKQKPTGFSRLTKACARAESGEDRATIEIAVALSTWFCIFFLLKWSTPFSRTSLTMIWYVESATGEGGGPLDFPVSRVSSFRTVGYRDLCTTSIFWGFSFFWLRPSTSASYDYDFGIVRIALSCFIISSIS